MLHRRMLLANSFIKRIDEHTYTYKITYSIEGSYGNHHDGGWNEYGYPINSIYIDTKLLTWRIYGNDGGYDDIIIQAPENVTLQYDDEGKYNYYTFEGSFTIPVNIDSNGFNIELTCDGNGAYYDNIRGFAHGSSLVIQKSFFDDSGVVHEPMLMDTVPENEISKKLSANNLHVEFANNNEITIIFHGSLRYIPSKYQFVIKEEQREYFHDYYLHMDNSVHEMVEILFPEEKYWVQIDGQLSINGDTVDVTSGIIEIDRSNLAPEVGWRLQTLFPNYSVELDQDIAIPVSGSSDTWKFTFLDDVYQPRWSNPDYPGLDTRHISTFQWIYKPDFVENGYGYYYN